MIAMQAANGAPANGGEANAPLWFQKEAFLKQDFACDAYVNDLRRYVPLETLNTELNNYLSDINHELVDLLNKDYTDFVNLSAKLVDVDGAVMRMRAPLVELQSKLKIVREDTSSALRAVELGLHQRQEAASTRSTLERMLHTANVLAKVEKLLAELKTEEETSCGMDADAHARLLERIASEVNRLKFYAANSQGFPLVEAMLPRIRHAEEELINSLRACLRSALERRDQVVSLHCLLAYAAMDDAAGGEADVRNVLIIPAVRKLLSAIPASSDVNLLYKKLYDGLKKECAFFMELIHHQHAGMNMFDFLGNSLLSELDAALSELHPAMFSAGVPATFLANYNASLRFLEKLETHCLTRAALQAFRSSAAMTSFLKRWNQNVYFKLRFQEIAGALDKALAGNPMVKSQGPDPQFALEVTGVVWQRMQQCWAADTYLPALSDRFLRMSLQLVARFLSWLRQGVEARNAHSQTQTQPQTQAPAAAPSSPAVPGGAAAGSAASKAHDWAVQASTEDLATLRRDASALAELLEGLYPSTVELTLAHLPEAAIESVRDAYSEAAAGLRAVLEDLDACVTAAVVDKCVDVLKQMRGITATYRMTNKPLPTRHSHFVPGVLGPLKGFVSGDHAEVLGKAATEALVATVTQTVTERYKVMANDLVTTVRKTESSLKRLKGRKAGAADDPTKGGKAEISDTDKICHQLLLDVQEYGRQLQYLSVAPTSLPSFKQLSEIVNVNPE